MDLKEAQRLRALEKENAELKGLLADQLLKTKALEIALEKTSEPGAATRSGQESSSRVVVFRVSRLLVAGGAPQHGALSPQACGRQEAEAGEPDRDDVP